MDKCFADKMGMERTPFGYFSQLRIHETSRPKPKSYTFEYENKTQPMTKEFQEEVKKLGDKSPITGFY